MRFLKPTKLGLLSASWLRHEVRVRACVAKTWRYFVSRASLVVLLVVVVVVVVAVGVADSEASFPRKTAVLAAGGKGEASMAEEEAIWVIVVMMGGQGDLIVVLNKARRLVPRAQWLRVVVATGAWGKVRQAQGREEACLSVGCGGRDGFVCSAAGTSPP